MTLKINDQDIELKYSFRSLMYYEQGTGKPFDFSNITPQSMLDMFFYIVIASLQKARQPVITMLDFLDVLDENGGEKCIGEFGYWFVDAMRKEYAVADSVDQEKPEDDKKQSKGKKNKN